MPTLPSKSAAVLAKSGLIFWDQSSNCGSSASYPPAPGGRLLRGYWLYTTPMRLDPHFAHRSTFRSFAILKPAPSRSIGAARAIFGQTL